MNTIDTLRESLFAALEGVKNGSLDLDRARAITDISQALINTGKLEVEYLKHTGRDNGTGFIPALPSEPQATLTHTGTAVRTSGGIVHKMR